MISIETANLGSEENVPGDNEGVEERERQIRQAGLLLSGALAVAYKLRELSEPIPLDPDIPVSEVGEAIHSEFVEPFIESGIASDREGRGGFLDVLSRFIQKKFEMAKSSRQSAGKE